MQRKCWNGKVYTKSTSTQNPGARKPAHAGTGASQNSKSRSATADRLNSLLLDFFNGIAYNKSVETQDGCHYTYVTQDTRSVASASVSRLFGADGSLLLIIPKSIPYLNDNPSNICQLSHHWYLSFHGMTNLAVILLTALTPPAAMPIAILSLSSLAPSSSYVSHTTGLMSSVSLTMS